MTKRSSNLLSGKSLKRAKRIAFFWIPTTLLVFMIALLALAGYATNTAPDQITHGVMLSSLDVGGLTRNEAEERLKNRLNEIRLVYTIDGQKIEISNQTEHGGQKIFVFDENEALSSALTVGKKNDRLPLALERLLVAFGGRSIPVPFTLNEPVLIDFLNSQLADQLSESHDAYLDLTVDQRTGQVDVKTVAEVVGQTISAGSAIDETNERLHSLNGGVIVVETLDKNPSVRLDDVKAFASEAAAVAGRAPLTLRAKGNFWTVSRELAANWLKVLPSDSSTGFRLGLDPEQVTKYLESHADALYVPPHDAIVELDEDTGRVIKIVPSIDGEGLDIPLSINAVEVALTDPSHGKNVDLPLTVVRPELPTEKANPWGVMEIIGEGSSYFAGSPANRRHNIAVGVATLNGIVIPPGEVFSTIGSLGEIDGEHGYRQELVIKDNKTTPEYGGGLCQIGSTVFRAALDSGLPVPERRNHSYRVSYYEYDGSGKYIGPGKDATIYDPAPDMKFTNDTGHHIIMMTRVVKDSLYFTLWGVRDGRTVEQSDVKVYNHTEPPPKKTVETDTLPPGEEKCTERPHAGADAVFTYTVTYPDGKVEEKNFYSHYRPWGEVCLVGIDPNAPKQDAGELDAAASADAAGVTGE